MMPQRASRRRILSIRACMGEPPEGVRTSRGRWGGGGDPGAPARAPTTDADLTERPSGTASNSLDVAELLEALSDLRFFLVGVGGVLGGLGRGRRGGFGTVFSHAGLFLPGRPRRRRARPRSGPGAAGGRGR